MGGEGGVFNLVGPVFTRQDLLEARGIVEKRMGIINGEMCEHYFFLRPKTAALDQ